MRQWSCSYKRKCREGIKDFALIPSSISFQASWFHQSNWDIKSMIPFMGLVSIYDAMSKTKASRIGYKKQESSAYDFGYRGQSINYNKTILGNKSNTSWTTSIHIRNKQTVGVSLISKAIAIVAWCKAMINRLPIHMPFHQNRYQKYNSKANHMTLENTRTQA